MNRSTFFALRREIEYGYLVCRYLAERRFHSASLFRQAAWARWRLLRTLAVVSGATEPHHPSLWRRAKAYLRAWLLASSEPIGAEDEEAALGFLESNSAQLLRTLRSAPWRDWQRGCFPYAARSIEIASVAIVAASARAAVSRRRSVSEETSTGTHTAAGPPTVRAAM